MKRSHLFQSLLLLTSASGCITQVRDEFDDTRVAWFNHRMAKAAYCEAAPLYGSVDCPQSFKIGFETGYIAMMNGGNGCPPVFPPSSRICSLAWLDDGTPEQRRNAWYDGYSHGVLMATQTGASDLNRIPARLPLRQVIDPAMLVAPALDPNGMPPAPTPVPLDPSIGPPEGPLPVAPGENY